MLHAPVELSIRNSKLEISRLLAGPSPNSSPRASQAPPSSRSISVPTSTPLYPLVTSPTPSTASHVSTATAPPTLYPQPERRTRGPSNLAAASRAPIVPPPRPNKRPPPDKPHSSASPAKKQSKWTPAEDAILIRLRLVDMGWEDISHHLPGRSMTSCRLHYQNYLEKRCNWDEEMSNKLARLYDRFKKQMWSIIATELQTPWRTCESMHWQLGQQDMARRAGVNLFTMAATSPSSPDGRSGVTAATGASTDSPGGIGGGASNPGGFGGPPGGGLPPIHPGIVGSREIRRRDDRELRRRSEVGRGRGMTVLPGVAELEGGVGLYYDDDDDDDDDEEEDEDEDEDEDEEVKIKKEDEERRMRSRKA